MRKRAKYYYTSPFCTEQLAERVRRKVMKSLEDKESSSSGVTRTVWDCYIE